MRRALLRGAAAARPRRPPRAFHAAAGPAGMPRILDVDIYADIDRPQFLIDGYHGGSLGGLGGPGTARVQDRVQDHRVQDRSGGTSAMTCDLVLWSQGKMSDTCSCTISRTSALRFILAKVMILCKVRLSLSAAF